MALYGLLAAAAWAQPRSTDAAALLGQALAAEKAGRIEAATRQFRAVLRASPAKEIEGQARLELVRIHQRRAEWWDAAEQLEALRRIVPQDGEYAYQLGVVYRSLSKWAFEQMRLKAPDSARTYQMMGEQYSVGGDAAKAKSAFLQAIAADPKLPGCHLALAVLYLREQERERALEEIDKELTIAPESSIALQVRQAITRGPR